VLIRSVSGSGRHSEDEEKKRREEKRREEKRRGGAHLAHVWAMPRKRWHILRDARTASLVMGALK
jgi:hypothetical protein